MTTSIWSRKRDLAYLIFFLTHVPIIFLIDTVPLQPAFLRTELSARLREFYIANYRDKFFEEPAPTWFTVFIAMELVYHLPLSLWAVRGLHRGKFSCLVLFSSIYIYSSLWIILYICLISTRPS